MLQLAIIDDELLFRQYLKKALNWEELGFNICFEARDGEEALEKFKETTPDVALIDITMPFMDGVQLASKVKELYPSTYIVFVTGHGEFEYAHKAIKLGVKDYILKPFNKEELIKTIIDIKNILDSSKKEKLFAAIRKDLNLANFYPDMIYEDLILDLKLHNVDGLISKINTIFEDISSKKLSLDFVYGISHCLIALCISFINSSCQNPKDIFGEDLDLIEKLDDVENLNNLKSYIEYIFITTANQCKLSKNTKGKKVVMNAKEYIDKNYFLEDLSLSKICSQVYVNESYLRALFKKELGMTISEYITSVRMNKAKELIKKGGVKFSDLCETIGYSDPAYFSKCFKKYFGMSPKDYEISLK